MTTQDATIRRDFAGVHSLRSAARYCEVTPNTVRNWILTGRLPAQKANGRTFILQEDLDKIAVEREAEQQAAGAQT